MALTNSQYDEIQRRYDAKQLRNQHTLQKRREKLYTLYPRFKEIEDSISAVSLQHAERLLDGDTNALSQLHEKLEGLRQERSRLYESLEISSDFLKPSYDCPDCKDTGFIDGRPCHCFQQAAIDLVYTQSNIRAVLENENFAHFKVELYSDVIENPQTGLTSRKTAQNAYDYALSFIEFFDSKFDNLFLYGDTGIGKTFLSNCIAKELLDSGHSVIYFSAFQLFDILEKSKFQKDEEAEGTMKNIFVCDLLIIDDLGTELANTFTVSQLFLCLNERILRKKSTIISTNLGIKQLHDTYSERIFSRILSNYSMIYLFGDDIRIKQRKQ